MSDEVERAVRTLVQGVIGAIVVFVAGKGFDVTAFVDVSAVSIAVGSVVVGVVAAVISRIMAAVTPAKAGATVVKANG